MELREFEEKFSIQEQCLDYLVGLRWPNGVCCQKSACQERVKRKRNSFKLTSQYRFKCPYCKHQTSVIAETMFQGTRYKMMPLLFRAIWYVTSQDNGTSVLDLQKFLGLGSYKTVWIWLQKLRQAMSYAEHVKLQGRVIVGDFSIIVKSRCTVLIAIEYDEKTITRIHMSSSYKDIDSFIKSCIKSGSTIESDSCDIRLIMSELGYTLKPTSSTHIANYDVLPSVHNVISYLEEKGLLGKLPPLGSEEYLDYYLGECCFKFNRRQSKGTWFDDFMKNAVEFTPLQKSNYYYPHFQNIPWR